MLSRACPRPCAKGYGRDADPIVALLDVSLGAALPGSVRRRRDTGRVFSESTRVALLVAAAGTGFGAVITVLLGHLEGVLRLRRKGLGAARLIRWELLENNGLVRDIREHGFTASTPIRGQTDLWLAH